MQPEFIAFIPFIIIPLVLIIIIIAIYFSFAFEKKRTEQLMQYALRHGFQFLSKPEKKSPKEFMKKDIPKAPLYLTGSNLGNFKLFQTGHSKKTYNVMKGKKGSLELHIFDYRYIVGGGKNSHTYNQTVIIAYLKTMLPKFILKKENLFHKLGDILGFKDIDFKQYPNFSKKYLLKGKDENKVRNLFTTQILQYFEQKDIKAQLESDSDKLLYYIPNKRTKLEEFDSFLNEAEKIIGLFDKEEF